MLFPKKTKGMKNTGLMAAIKRKSVNEKVVPTNTGWMSMNRSNEIQSREAWI